MSPIFELTRLENGALGVDDAVEALFRAWCTNVLGEDAQAIYDRLGLRMNPASAIEIRDMAAAGVKIDLLDRIKQEQVADFAAEFSVSDAETRTVEIIASSEVPVIECGRWWTRSHEPGAILLDRLKAHGPLLWRHDPNRVIGRVENVRVEDRQIHARARFLRAGDAFVDLVWDGIRDGIIRGVSIFSMCYQAAYLGRRDDRPWYRADQWEPFEITITPMPKDISVGVNPASIS